MSAAQVEPALLRLLRQAIGAPDTSFEGEPVRLTGGFWAELVSFRLSGAPSPWDQRLVVRLMPNEGLARRETIVQAEVAEQGFATPRVHLAGDADGGLGRAFMVMDHAEGAPLLAGLAGGSAILRLPALARRIPDTLAAAMASLHRIDAAPIRRRLAPPAATATAAGGSGVALADVSGEDSAHGHGGSGVALAASEVGAHAADDADSPHTTVAGAGDGMAAFLVGLEAAAQRLGRADLVAAARWLAAHPPPDAPDVVCHGDLHPFNVLVADDGSFTVLDWSAANLAPAAYDAAFTSLVLSEPPLYVPRAVRPIVRAIGRMLARRFLRTYEHESGTALNSGSLRWHQGVVCLRALVEAAHWVVADELDSRQGHPWLVSGRAFADRLSTLTGQPVRRL